MTFKLFLVILACCTVIAVTVAGALSINFNRGFLGYLNEQEAQRLDMLQPRLEQAYLEHGSWAFLRESPAIWVGLLGIPASTSAGSGINRMPERRGQTAPDVAVLNARLSLLDAQHRLVIGGGARMAPAASLRPLVVQGRTVGWLALVPFQQITAGAALRFQQQQLQSNWAIAVVAILIAALAAWLLAHMMLAPVKRVAKATRQLASGDYAIRVPPGSRDELGVLSQDFNRLAVTLGKNEALRRAFMSDVSHELRTPLAILRGELEAIEDGIRPLTHGAVASLQAEVGTLGKLVDDLYELSLSDVGALNYRMAPVDVTAVLRTCLTSFSAQFAARRIGVVLSAPAVVHCTADQDRLRQLFHNLLKNTLLYTDAGGHCSIEVSTQEGHLRMIFDDSAPGIPPDQLHLIFERFFRAGRAGPGGAGLGLAISSNIVEAHAGRIESAPSPLGGLRLVVTMPLNLKEPT